MTGNEHRAYTLPELAEVSAIDYRTLHNWQKRGMLRPARQTASGSGTVNLFDEADALQILMLAELRRAGVEVRVLEQIADRIRELSAQANGEELLVISDAEVAVERLERLHESISAEHPTLVISLTRARSALAQLSEAPRKAA